MGVESSRDYYGRPVLKEPVWIWAVPAYFFAGGTAGAASTLAAAARLVAGGRLAGLTRRGRRIAAIGLGASAALLTYDLGRPERFLNMLRVFRPSSPMNLGSWLLAVATPAAFAADAFEERNEGIARGAGAIAGVLGPALSTYTAVLLSTTAVPVWNRGARTLPALFAMSSASSAAGALELGPLDDREARVVAIVAAGSRAAELAAGRAYEKQLERDEEVVVHLRSGLGGTLWTASKWLGAGALAAALVSHGHPGARRAGGLLALAGGLAMRFAVFHAGRSSTRSPEATFGPQRRALDQ